MPMRAILEITGRGCKEAGRLRNELRALLTPVLSRTERARVASPNPLAETEFLDADPSP